MDIVSWTFGNLDPNSEEPAYIDANDPTRYLTSNGVRTLVRKLVAGFTAHGLQKGDSVCVLSFNDINYTALYLGIMGAGGCFAGANPGYTVRELSHHVKVTGTKFLLIDVKVLDVATAAAKECGIPLSNIVVLNFHGEATPDGYRSWNSLLDKGEKDWVRIKDQDTTAAYFSTSGTTGFPKAAIISHGYLVSQAISLEQVCATQNSKENDPWLFSIPAFHAFAIPFQHVLALRQKNKPAYILPRFNDSVFVDLLQKYKIRSTAVVPPILLSIVKYPESVFKSLRTIFFGGSNLAPGVVEQMYTKLHPSAIVNQVFGMTELGICILWNRKERDLTNSIGQPLPGYKVRVVDDEGNVLSGPGATGQLEIFGEHIMKGYRNNREATDEVFTADHWIRTGDIGYSKDENWYVVDRAKDLFKVRGWQVSPAEIEAALIEHPDVLDSGVIGVPAADGCGDTPMAFIEVQKGSLLDEEGVKKFLVPYLARYKNLGEVKFIDKIPRNPTGKILRRELRAMREADSATNTKCGPIVMQKSQAEDTQVASQMPRRLPVVEKNDTANLGVLGRLYSALNVLGFYRATAFIAVGSYSTAGISDPDSWFTDRFDQALYRTVQHHPSLCYGIIDQAPEKEAHFLRLPAIHRDDVVEFCGQSPKYETEDEDSVLARLLEKFHVRRLFEGHRIPAWRIVIFKHGGEWGSKSSDPPPRQKISFAFLANHGLADGLSLANFFNTFFRFFNNAQTEPTHWPFTVPEDFKAAVPLEKTCDLAARDENDIGLNFDPNAKIWSGADMFLTSIEDYGTGVRLVSIPHAPLSNALQLCKKHKISLTGLLNSLLLIYLSKAAPSDHGFRSIIPYSMRHVTRATHDEILNHASGLVCEYSESIVSEMRSSTENSTEELDLIVKLGLECRQKLTAELVRCPKNNLMAGMIGVDDWYSSSKRQLGQKRALTFGISNLGVVGGVEDVAENAILRLEKMVISQCGSVTGPVFGFNSASIPGGPLAITLTWQKGVVEEKFFDEMAKYLSRRLMSGLKELSELSM
ncbi:Acyl-CoA ligase [Lachnellula hyalina]|uniref:Acyl-CoA ligase n=1 Tax=Lachnellula hyalina TaxID=1316788 RepID=A0A8H8TY07_9HELO|nr:Acyl-CoA ligase [Lachnellula hyalina]TVY23471.1 Acyl-CoA ligase [Lachnellula hyalina]